MPLLDARVTVDGLDADGAARDAALFRLRAFLVAVAWFELDRRRRQLTLSRADSARLVRDSAEAAYASVQSRLADYHGQSRFSVWAAKFAIHETAARARENATQGRKGRASTDTDGGATNGDRRT